MYSDAAIYEVTESASKGFEPFKKNAGESGKQATTNLAAGLRTNKWDSDDAAKTVVTGAGTIISSIDDNTYIDGKNAVSNLASGIRTNKGSSDDAAQTVVTGAGTIFDKIDDNTYNNGYSAVEQLSNGISNAKWQTDNAAWGIANGVTSQLAHINGQAYEWGKDICEALRGGMEERQDWVSGAAWNIAGDVHSILGFSEPEKGPLSDFHTYMPDMIELMAKGIKDNEGTAVKAVSELAGRIADEAENMSVLMPIDSKAGFMDSFADKITNGFTALIERLEAIAERVQFRVPAFATGTVLPYSAGGSDSGTASYAPDYSVITQRMDELSQKLDRIEDAIDNKETGITEDAVYRSVKRSAKKESKSTGRNPFD